MKTSVRTRSILPRRPAAKAGAGGTGPIRSRRRRFRGGVGDVLRKPHARGIRETATSGWRPPHRHAVLAGSRLRGGRGDHRRLRLPLRQRRQRARARRALNRARPRAHDQPRGPGRRADDPGAVDLRRQGEGFQAWYFGADGRLVAPVPGGPALEAIEAAGRRSSSPSTGGRFIQGLPGGEVTIVSVPVFGRTAWISAPSSGATRGPRSLCGAIDRIADDSLRALAIAVVIGILAGALVATAIAHRVKRLARRRRRWRRAASTCRSRSPAATRSATSRARSTRCERRSARASGCSPPTATSSRRSSTASPTR